MYQLFERSKSVIRYHRLIYSMKRIIIQKQNKNNEKKLFKTFGRLLKDFLSYENEFSGVAGYFGYFGRIGSPDAKSGTA